MFRLCVLLCRTTNLVIRGAMLFSVGVFLALVLNLLQVQRNVTLFPPDVISSIFSSAWWVPPCCGTASGTFSRSFSPSAVQKRRLGFSPPEGQTDQSHVTRL